MEIRKSMMEDLPRILALYEQARAFMKANGNPDQWGDSYPEEEIVRQDIEEGRSYVCETDGEIAGVFYFSCEPDPDYARIDDGGWLNDAPYGVVHRITASSRQRGVASFCLDWAFSQCGNLRIDTYKDNQPMQNLLKKKGFTRCGIIYVREGSPRIAFQKLRREE